MIDKQKKLVTAEAVRRGHPDKFCDQIADAILDAHLSYDPNARVAVEVMATAGNNELTLTNNGWYSVAEAMSNAQATIAAIGGDIAQAESEFRLATVGIEDMESSVQGLSAQMDMLSQKWQLGK